MRENVKLFLDEVIEKMPHYTEFLRDNIIAWIGFSDNEDFDFTTAYKEGIEHDEYIEKYTALALKLAQNIKSIKVVKELPSQHLTTGIGLLDDWDVNMLVSTFDTEFTEYVDPDNPDRELYWEIRSKYPREWGL